jgi:hypothetical protein
MGNAGLAKSLQGRFQEYNADEHRCIPMFQRWFYSCISDAVPVKIIK